MNDETLEEAHSGMFRTRDPYRDRAPLSPEERRQRRLELLEGRAGSPTRADVDRALDDLAHGRPAGADLREETETQSRRLTEQTREVLEAAKVNGKIITGVAVLGPVSRNGRRYSKSALEDVARLIREDGTKVFLDHDKGKRNRSVKDLVGTLSNPRVVEDRVRASLNLLDTDHADLLKSLAEDNVKDVGLSISARGDIDTRRDGEAVVKEVTELRSVDVVVSPATVRSLSESTGPEPVGDDELAELYDQLFA